MATVRFKRLAGVFCPVASLPSAEVIGDFGPAAHRFVDWLARAGQSVWQILPLTIPDGVGSPYDSCSSCAGDWRLVSPEILSLDGLLPPSRRSAKLNSRPIDHRQARQIKWRQIRRSYDWFKRHGSRRQRQACAGWQHQQRSWLEKYTLFAAINDQQRHRPWWRWPKQYRTPTAAARHLTSSLTARRQLHAYAQWLFDRQWAALKRHANHRGIKIMGDLPFYPTRHSDDVWSRPRLFHLNRRHQPVVVAGAPPDVFTRTGQKWGNPVYNWPALRRDRYQWWNDRIDLALRRYDLLRLDHFHGYDKTWAIAPTAKDGRQGRWLRSPGAELLRGYRRHWPRRELIAEDLGRYNPAAEKLMRRFRLPGIRVMIYGFSGLPGNIHHPLAIKPPYYFFTSTHDTNTVLGWWRQEAKPYERRNVRNLAPGNRPINWRFIATVYASPARAAIVPIQDICGLGAWSRLNHPGIKRGNWAWRWPPKYLDQRLADRLQRLVRKYDRDG